MLKSTNLLPPPDGQHSFLFWLIVPVLLLWLATSYLIGTFIDRPQWTSAPSLEANPSFQQFSPLPENNTGYITFWFDDAWLSQYLIAYPILQTQSYPGVIAVPTSAIDTKDYMNWAQLQNLQKSGWEITNHSVSHNCNMQTWTAGDIQKEYQVAKMVLWKHQLASDIFVTPCGVDSPVMRAEAAKVFLAYRTVDNGFNDMNNLNLFNLKIQNLDDQISLDAIKSKIDQSRQNRTWLILVFHQLGDNRDAIDSEKYNMEQSMFSQIVDYVKLNSIPVIVPGQVIFSTQL